MCKPRPLAEARSIPPPAPQPPTVPWRRGGGASYLLTLEGHSGQTIYFFDRPDRIVGTAPTQDFLEGLGFSPANPPNAALVAEFKAGQGVVVLELITSAYDPQKSTLTYGVEGLQTFAGENLEAVTRDQVVERLPAEFGPAALFIDDCPSVIDCYESRYEYYDYCEGSYCPLGPIPGGPYETCWNLLAFDCVPCKDSWTYGQLEQMCADRYGCFVGSGDGACLIWHVGPPHP